MIASIREFFRFEWDTTLAAFDRVPMGSPWYGIRNANFERFKYASRAYIVAKIGLFVSIIAFLLSATLVYLSIEARDLASSEYRHDTSSSNEEGTF